MNQNTELPLQPSTDVDEVDMLELLATVAENLKLLILGPIVAGLIALGVGYVVKPTYESVSVLQSGKVAPELVASLARSADVLQAVAKDMDIAPDESHASRLKLMQARVSAAVGRQDKLITLTTQASTPERAQKLNLAVWQRIYPLTRPLAVDAVRIQAQIKTLQQDLDAGIALAQSTAKRLDAGSVSEGSARLYADVRSANVQRTLDISNLQAQLEGLTGENLVQQPTQTDKPVKPKKALIAIVVALATGMVLLVFIFIREALRNTRRNPAQADTLRRLRAALRLKP